MVMVLEETSNPIRSPAGPLETSAEIVTDCQLRFLCAGGYYVAMGGEKLLLFIENRKPVWIGAEYPSKQKNKTQTRLPFLPKFKTSKSPKQIKLETKIPKRAKSLNLQKTPKNFRTNQFQNSNFKDQFYTSTSKN